MKFGTLFQTCFYFCLILAIATVMINFVEGLDIFGNPDIRMGVNIDATNDANVFSELTGLSGGLEYFWGLAVGVGIAFTGIVAYATQSTTPIGVYLFGVLFWTSWTRLVSVTGGYIPSEFFLAITVGLAFLFAGAVIGMLTGGG